MERLSQSIEELIEENKIKTKWSELECHGAAEFLNMLFQEQAAEGSLSQAVLVENHVVCMNLYEGIPYLAAEGLETIIRMYINIEDNIVFLSRSGCTYLYETNGVDAGDYRHFYGKD